MIFEGRSYCAGRNFLQAALIVIAKFVSKIKKKNILFKIYRIFSEKNQIVWFLQ